MPYRSEDWMRLVQGLVALADLLARARAADSRSLQRQQFLDQAVWHAWRFAEYAVNVVLQLAGRPPEQHHQLPARVEELRAGGLLQGDYAGILEKLTRYRLKADYMGYSRHPSVHYSPSDLERCLRALEGLRDEVDGLLRQRGWL